VVFNATKETIFQLYRGGQFIGGGNRSTRRKPPTCRNLHIVVLFANTEKCINTFIVFDAILIDTLPTRGAVVVVIGENHRPAVSH
jgi:hypothetical protein